MRCPKCNAPLEDDSQFCSECGAKIERQVEESHEKYCMNCGTKLFEDAAFCSECGASQDGKQQKEYVQKENVQKENTQRAVPQEPADVYKKKGGGLPVILIITAIVILVVGGIGYMIYHSFIAPAKDVTSDWEVEENVDDSEEIDPDDVDIDAVEDSYCTLEGTLERDSNGEYLLEWEDGLNIYALDEDDEEVLVQGETEAYIDATHLKAGSLDAVEEGTRIKVSGDVSVEGDSVCMIADEAVNEDGSEITKKNSNDKTKSSAKSSQSMNNSKNNSGSNSDYILPQSSSQVLTSADISGLSLQQLNYAKNEIYARHGRKFDSPELQNYFNSKSWYQGTVSPSSFDNSMLSDVEKKNAEFLSNAEKAMDSNGYQLDK